MCNRWSIRKNKTKTINYSWYKSSKKSKILGISAKYIIEKNTFKVWGAFKKEEIINALLIQRYRRWLFCHVTVVLLSIERCTLEDDVLLTTVKSYFGTDYQNSNFYNTAIFEQVVLNILLPSCQYYLFLYAPL